MKSIISFIKRFSRAVERRERARFEAYLAGATDLYDLDGRMRKLDRGCTGEPMRFTAVTGSHA